MKKPKRKYGGDESEKRKPDEEEDRLLVQFTRNLHPATSRLRREAHLQAEYRWLSQLRSDAAEMLITGAREGKVMAGSMYSEEIDPKVWTDLVSWDKLLITARMKPKKDA